MSIPKPTFKIKMGDFEGCIGNLEKFRELDLMERADLLQDWIVELIDEYNETLDLLFPKANSKFYLASKE
jgi:hypothetical protein